MTADGHTAPEDEEAGDHVTVDADEALDDPPGFADGFDTAFAPAHHGPVNWDTLEGEHLRDAWTALDSWVNWLRRTYGLPATVIPPLWHRHPELVWELSALHHHWTGSYAPDQRDHTAPVQWHRDLADATPRLRDWTATSGTRIDHDRPTPTTTWPGEPRSGAPPDRPIVDRAEDFEQFLDALTTAQPSN